MLQKCNLSSDEDIVANIIRVYEEERFGSLDESRYELLREVFPNLGLSEYTKHLDSIVAFHKDAKNEGAYGNVGYNDFDVRTLTALPDANNVYHNYKGVIDTYELWFNGNLVIGTDLYYLDKEE